MRAVLVIVSEPRPNACAASSSEAKLCNHRHCSLTDRINRSTIPFCCGVCGRINSCLMLYQETVRLWRRLEKTKPLSDRIVKSSRARPRVPYRLIRASSRAASASLAFPVGLSRQPSSSHVQQSMTNVSEHQRYCSPHQTRAISVAQRSLGLLAAEGRDCTRGR